jgi:hypothetical protein
MSAALMRVIQSWRYWRFFCFRPMNAFFIACITASWACRRNVRREPKKPFERLKSFLVRTFLIWARLMRAMVDLFQLHRRFPASRNPRAVVASPCWGGSGFEREHPTYGLRIRRLEDPTLAVGALELRLFFSFLWRILACLNFTLPDLVTLKRFFRAAVGLELGHGTVPSDARVSER